MTRSAAFKEMKLGSSEEEDQHYHHHHQQQHLLQGREVKKQKKKKISSWVKDYSSLSWQAFMQNLDKDEELVKLKDNNNSDFYHIMIRLSFELPSADDEVDRQFQLEQQRLREEGKFKKDHRFTPSERKKYSEKVQASEGFDVPTVPDHIYEFGLIKPRPDFTKNPRIFERVKNCAKLALHGYNKQHKAKYQFVKVLKVNARRVAGCVYYITFEAKPMMDMDAPPDNFQTRVYAGITETKVDFCRPEQKSS